eukprot:TRINITY_DN38605_c0_g1_i1.p2 TRINITY_DN38605_c0_g1~~TRINITY_DN38605_c0_g1_i1.p2  ORF type:complete len:188 (-),score=35.77 TRINITY_DN38605_c0_g1_i1:478-1041(-)
MTKTADGQPVTVAPEASEVAAEMEEIVRAAGMMTGVATVIVMTAVMTAETVTVMNAVTETVMTAEMIAGIVIVMIAEMTAEIVTVGMNAETGAEMIAETTGAEMTVEAATVDHHPVAHPQDMVALPQAMEAKEVVATATRVEDLTEVEEKAMALLLQVATAAMAVTWSGRTQCTFQGSPLMHAHLAS